MSEREDLAALIKNAYYHARDHGGTMHTAADDAADAILNAGWVPGELLAAEQARNATLTDTIQRVEAVLDEHDRTRNVRFQAGLHPGTSLIDPGIVRAILDTGWWREADDQGGWLDTDEHDAYTPAAFRRDDPSGDTP